MSKTAETENFPVASRLLPASWRVVVMAYYRFARAADDIADAPDLSPAEKIRRLDAMEAALTGAADEPACAWCEDIGRILTAHRIPHHLATDLLRAFRQDASRKRYDSEEELLAYCRWSAAPVGRFLLRVAGEDEAAMPASDALCALHQVLNHLHDAKIDFMRLDRVYLPRSWFVETGAVAEMLSAERASPPVRGVFDRGLALCDRLLVDARPLPGLVRHPLLRVQARTTVVMASRLMKRLSREDPLARQIGLSRFDKIAAVLAGLPAGLGARMAA